MVRSVAAWKNFPSLNARDTMSAIVLSTPATWMGVMDDALAAWIRMPRRRWRRPAVALLDVLIWYAHATADILSQYVTRCLYLSVGSVCSRRRNAMTAPASSSTLIDNLPRGFSLVRRACLISCGHSNCQRNGSSVDVPEHHTPPAPSPHASV